MPVTGAIAQQPNSAIVAPAPETAELRQQLVDARSDYGSAVLILMNGGTITAVEHFGQAQANASQPLAIDQTHFIMASVSKLMTAWGILHLVEQGQLDLDAPAMTYLQRWQFPPSPYRDRVTLRQLLSHTGGLEDGFGYAGFLPHQPVQTLIESLNRTEDVVSGSPRGVAVTQPPGKKWRYSGGGYAVLELVIEEVSGQPFATFMQERILNPLGMTTASFDVTLLPAGTLATSYTDRQQPDLLRRYAVPAAAALYATPTDLQQWLQAFARPNPVLSAATLRMMATPQAATQNRWGLGPALYGKVCQGMYLWGHDGINLPGFGHTLRFNPATGNGIIVLVSGNTHLAAELGNQWVSAEQRHQCP
ncbi:serine hydrolase domain-containing protein [Parathermosynechococcus lividus]